MGGFTGCKVLPLHYKRASAYIYDMNTTYLSSVLYSQCPVKIAWYQQS